MKSFFYKSHRKLGHFQARPSDISPSYPRKFTVNSTVFKYTPDHKVEHEELPEYFVAFDTSCTIIKKSYLVNHQRLMQITNPTELSTVVKKAES